MSLPNVPKYTASLSVASAPPTAMASTPASEQLAVVLAGPVDPSSSGSPWAALPDVDAVLADVGCGGEAADVHRNEVDILGKMAPERFSCGVGLLRGTDVWERGLLDAALDVVPHDASHHGISKGVKAKKTKKTQVSKPTKVSKQFIFVCRANCDHIYNWLHHAT